MKNLKMLGLLAVAAASLMAFAGSASATNVFTSPAGTHFTGTIHASLESGTTAVVKAGIEDTCAEATIHGTITVNNTTHAEGALTGGTPPTGLTFGKCTAHTAVGFSGSLTINDKGEVFSRNSRVEVYVTGIARCYYGAEVGSVKIGTLTGGTPATLDVNTTSLQKETGSDFLCASNGTWTGSYVVTSPSSLFIT